MARASKKMEAVEAETTVALDGQDFDEIAEEMVEDEELAHGLPLIKGARVVYIGARRNMGVALIGRILDEPVYSDTEVETELDQDGNEVPVLDENGHTKAKRVDTLKTCIADGVQSYDFSTHDSKQRPIKQHRLPMDAPPDLAGRRYVVCEHPDHLREFQRRVDGNGTKDFRILVPKKYRATYQDYVANKDHLQGRRDLLLKRTTTEGAE